MKAGHDYIGVGVGAMVFHAEGQVTKDSLDSYWAMGIEDNSIPG